MNNSMGDFSVDEIEEQDETSPAMIMLTTLRPVSAISAEAKLEMYLMTFSSYKMASYINNYVLITEVVVGSVANILALVVMLGLLKLTICNYMAALAVADLSVVLGPALIRWMQNVSHDPRALNSYLCRFLNIQSYWSFSLSAWLLVAMTIDRYIAITFPLKALVWSTPRRARFVIAALMLLMFLINMHFFFTAVVVKRRDDQQYGCVFYDPYKQFIEDVWPWLDATVYSFIPFSCLLVFNYLIIRSQKRSAKAFSSLKGFVKNHKSRSPTRINQKLTMTLLTVSFIFLALTAPRIILIIIRTSVFNFKPTPTTIDFKVLADYTLTASIINVLIIGNHCINFFLYILTGRKFRQQIILMFKQCWPKRLKHKNITSVQSCNTETNSQNGGSRDISTVIDVTEL
ncbi:G-protein coupled estrogen receptor 1-like [Biomphalaria glabrata]|uniref:G-protein coupled estrogen receptor 1-like n=1 Tax=Biomphalaria glabrata TaxID=6526 RepID=A0A9U8EIJ8_BIOGL|nr:G-protein coupled estrogen receptor 1-like [Biomphalaria glabrata]